MMLLTVLPYLYAFGLTPPGMKYQWLLFNPDEPNVHLAWMRQAFEGHLLFLDPFTTEPQKATFFHALFLKLGALARVGHLPLVGVYHAFRLISGVLLLHSLYWLAAHFFRSVRIRRMALWVAVCSSGWGWLAFLLSPGSTDPALFGLRPVDVSRGLMMPEAFTFPTLLLYPLFSFSMFLMVCCFLLLLRSLSEKNAAIHWRSLAGAGLCGLLLGNLHTYDLLVVYAVAGTWLVLEVACKRTKLMPAAIALIVLVAVSCPSLVYQYLNFRMNPVFREKALTLTPPRPILDMVASYGFVLLLSLVGAVVVARKHRTAFLPVCWLLIGGAIIYAPLSFSRKMIEGLHLPMSLLAALGLIACLNAAFRKRAKSRTFRSSYRAAAALALCVMCLSNLQFLRLIGGWVTDNNLSRSQWLMPPYYLSRDDLAAVAWLAKNTSNKDVVVCAPFLGSYVPTLSGNIVFLGHWAETLRFASKFDLLCDLLHGRDSGETILQQIGASRTVYLLVGRYERLIGPRFAPSALWRETYRHGDAALYRWGGSQ